MSIRQFIQTYKYLSFGFLFLILLRIVMNQSMGLMPQDAYYYYYSEHLALSYFDHPPMVAYMLKAFSIFLGKSLFTIKFADLAVSLLSLFFFHKLAQLLLSNKKAIFSTILFGTTLITTLSSINTTPDVPLILFWILSMYTAYKVIENNKLSWWILMGISMGLAFDSKYTAIFLPFGFLLFLVITKEQRSKLFSPKLLLAVLLYFVTIAPIFIWNYQNDWISFAFQSSGRAEKMGGISLQPKFFFGNIATQLFIAIPVFFGLIVFYFQKQLKKVWQKRKIGSSQLKFLLAFTLPLLLFFYAVSSIYWVKLNWQMPAYIGASIWIGMYVSRKSLLWQLAIALVIHLALLVQIIFYPVNIQSNDTWYGWEQLIEGIEKVQEDHPEHFIFSDDNYKLPAIMNFYIENDVYAGNVFNTHGLQFSLENPDLSHLLQRDAIYIKTHKRFKNLEKHDKMPRRIDIFFDSYEQLEPIIIRDKSGNALRKYLVYIGKDYGYRKPVKK